MGDLHSRIRADLVVNILTIRAFNEKKIVVNGGNQWRPIISVEDIAGYIREACEKKHEGLYNLAYKNVKIKDLSEEIVDVFPDIDVEYVKKSFQDERNYRVSTDLVNSVFDYRPVISVRQEIYNIKYLLENKRIKDPFSILYNNGLYIANKRF